MQKNAKIYVAGHRAPVGPAQWSNLRCRGYARLICRNHEALDLTDVFPLHALGGHHRIEIEESVERLYRGYAGQFQKIA